jgi:hypothetical protein
LPRVSSTVSPRDRAVAAPTWENLMHDWLTFELQRRVNQPFDGVRRALKNPQTLDTGMTIGLESEGLFTLQAPFREASFPYENALHAPGVLTSSHGHRIALIRLEITASSEEATSLALRPLSHRPDHWHPRRLQHYFAAGHLAADAVAHILQEEAASHDSAGWADWSRAIRADRRPGGIA